MKVFKIKNLFKVILIFTIYLTHVWISSLYLAPRNVDFAKYYDYINYFLGLRVDIDYGQGVLYYFLIAFILNRKIDIIDFYNSEFIISNAVHNVNLFFFIIGLAGIYSLLNLKKFKEETIYISLIVLVFFPQTIYMRAVMKPEIIGFAFLPWTIFYIEKFLYNRNLKLLFYTIPFVALMINSKASIAGMICIFLLFAYLNIFKKVSFKNLTVLFLVLILTLSALQLENYSITSNTIIDRPYDEEYDFKADPSILYKFSIQNLVNEPFFKISDYGESLHSRSLINLLLLDTFGDFFNQMFDFQANYFSQYRKDIFIDDSEVLITENREINYSGPYSNILKNNLDKIRKIISLLISVLFYLSIISLSIRKNEYRKFYLAPFAGILLLYLNSLGIPSNNYNPIKGDTFKAFYFGLLLSISLVFLVANIIEKVPIAKYFFPIVFIMSILFISGHPKENSQNLSEHLVSVNQYSSLCEVNNFLFYENEILKKAFPSGNINNLYSDCEPVRIYSNNDRVRIKYDEFHLSNCVDENNLILNNAYENASSNTKECRIYTFEQIQNKKDLINYKRPYFSIIIFIIALFFIFCEYSNNVKKIVKRYFV